MGLIRTFLKTVGFKLDDFGSTKRLPQANTADGTRDVAYELPVTRDMLSGGLADWPEDVYDLDPNGYALIHRCPPIVSAVAKTAQAIAKLDWTWRGGNAKRRDQFKRIFEQCIGWSSYFAWMEWAAWEGYRAHQIKPVDTSSNQAQPEFVTTDWRLGGRRKWKAGPTNGKGTVHWDGTRLVAVQQWTGVASDLPKFEAEELPRDEFVILRPGSGSNPEGDMDLQLIAYDIAKMWETGRLNLSKYIELYSVPMRAYEKRTSKARPTAVTGLLESAQTKNEMLRSGSMFTLPEGDAIKLFQVNPGAIEDLWAHMRELAGLVWQIRLGQKLTQDTADAGPTGSSGVALSEKQIAILALAMEHAEALNSDWVPWVADRNRGALAPLVEGETECYLWPQPPGSEDSGDSDTQSAGDAEEEAADDPMPPDAEMVKEMAERDAREMQGTKLSILAHQLSVGELSFDAARELAAIQCDKLDGEAVAEVLQTSAAHAASLAREAESARTL